MDITILYFTGNTKDSYFAEKIRQNILRYKGDLPIVSVSQKSLDFGQNICVGEHDPCYLNIDRQVQIGLKIIKTQYILTANDDFLYPPEYFSFRPQEPGKCYRYDNVWVCYKDGPFYFKGYSDGAQLIDRELWLEAKNNILKGRKMWAKSGEHTSKEIHLKYLIRTDKNYTWSGRPVVDFKTGKDVSPKTETIKKVAPQDSLLFWGKVDDLRKMVLR